MPYRSPVPFNSTSEQGTATAINLGSGTVTTQGLVPKSSNGNNIVGMAITFDASVQQSTATNWRVSDLFASMRINKGSSERVNIQGYRQLVALFNSLTRLDDSADKYFSDPLITGVVGTSTGRMTVFLPLEFTTTVIPVCVFGFNGFSAAGADGGTVTAQITYFYGQNAVEDDYIHIVTVPSTLAADTTIDVSQYFSFTGVVNEVWMDIQTDGNMLEQTFRFGSNPVFDKYTAWQLRADTNPAVFSLPVDGLLRCKTVPVAFPPNGVSGSKPILDVNYTTAVQPTFYLYSKIA